ncbi:TPA: cytidine deaminase [Candidatus Uhrbacteria bacterium]|uniref:Cytidine deaminase n=2 Tax=Candidatus Uhriibacteriota TaxID=1752732 RepID=A0A0G1QA69_9BACT|nr:MAG: Cytidine deaminase [Candidatus Uhrbacteria bacterium GW2011_GWF2_46_218]KKU41687.1 MAG: Cytidine deaminase [Candidatus Uhrbacteria bacterium GW2011_GWE2_46_68]HBK33444.1 cytidine deaminase [Candidatus Uhrbacteria bacterium]HCB19129.1 cytidine deaminase [Candidatus Uhrbacteria bacterium]
MTNKKLIQKAASLIRPVKIQNYLIGDVGCALVTDKNHIFVGVCADLCSGMGFCAEKAAIAAMITEGEFKIKTIVAVWKNEKGENQILPPCGSCRELIRQVHQDNLQTAIILKTSEIVKLEVLLPHHNWFG